MKRDEVEVIRKRAEAAITITTDGTSMDIADAETIITKDLPRALDAYDEAMEILVFKRECEKQSSCSTCKYAANFDCNKYDDIADRLVEEWQPKPKLPTADPYRTPNWIQSGRHG
jgi:hypothetical protein